MTTLMRARRAVAKMGYFSRHYVLVVLLTLGALVVAPTANAATSITLIAAPGVGQVVLSWTSLGSHGVTYAITSDPVGKTCLVVDATSCSVIVNDAVPWRFKVTASVDGKLRATSNWTTPLRRRYLIVLAGQSNALGFTSYAVDPSTGINYMAPPYTNAADSRDQLDWLPWNLKAMLGSGPVGLDAPQIIGSRTIFGPEIGMARTLSRDDGIIATIVKDVYFGTSLVKNWNPENHHGLFSEMVRHVNALMAADAAAGQFDVIGSFVWYQGETDALLGGGAYRQQLVGFLNVLRRSIPMSPHAEVVLVKESIAALVAFKRDYHSCGTDHCDKMATGDRLVRASDDWVASNVSAVSEVDSLGLDRTKSSYFIHLSNVGELQLGQMIAKAFEKTLVGASPASTSARAPRLVP